MEEGGDGFPAEEPDQWARPRPGEAGEAQGGPRRGSRKPEGSRKTGAWRE